MISNPILYKRQYIGHARHEGYYPENTLPLYKYLVDELRYKIIEADVVFTKDNVPVLSHGTEAILYKDKTSYNIHIPECSFGELHSYSTSAKEYIPITNVEEFIAYGKKSNIMVMLDLSFQKYTLSHYRILYSIVNGYGMLPNTIWADPSILKLAFLNPRLICQFSGSWGRKLLITTFLKSFFCKTTIMSFSYYGGNIASFSSIPRIGHVLGFIMKVATVNEKSIADEFWNIGTDLINTDRLLNTDIL